MKRETDHTEQKEQAAPEQNHRRSGAGVWIALQVLLCFYALSGVCSKTAAGEPFLSLRFCLFYGLMILILGVYALIWQQIIKRMPLTVAYANKAVSVLWACIFGRIFFAEEITPGKIAGCLIVAAGVILFAFSDAVGTDREKEREEREDA